MKRLRGIWDLIGFFALGALVVFVLRALDGADPVMNAMVSAGILAFIGLVFVPVRAYLSKQAAKTPPPIGGACVGCGYNLAGIKAAKCPECGRDVLYDETGVSQQSTLTWLTPSDSGFNEVDIQFDVGPIEVDLVNRAATDAMPAMQALLKKRRRDAYVAGSSFMALGIFLGALVYAFDVGGSAGWLPFVLFALGLLSFWNGTRGIDKGVRDSLAQYRAFVRANDPERGKTYVMRLRATRHSVLYESSVDRLEMSWIQIHNVLVLEEGAVLTTSEGGGILAPRSAFETTSAFRDFVKQARSAIDDVRAQANLPARPVLPDESEPETPPTMPFGRCCPRCGYDVGAIPGGACPECGPQTPPTKPV